MKKKRFSVEQVVGVLKPAEVGVPIGELVRQGGRHGIAIRAKHLGAVSIHAPAGGATLTNRVRSPA